jgi:hypothetical protein
MSLGGVTVLDRLGAFIETYRSRMDNKNNNLFAASAGAWWTYYRFLAIILARFDHSNADYVEAQNYWMKWRPEAGTTRPMTPEDREAWQHLVARTLLLHLDIESFYLFAKILLDRIADTFGLVFGVKRTKSGSSYSDLSKRFEKLCREKGLKIRPDGLPALISKLSDAIVDYRNQEIEHLAEPRYRGTVSSPGQASSIAAGARQTEDPHALLRMLEEYIEAMRTFFEVNAQKSPLIVS